MKRARQILAILSLTVSFNYALAQQPETIAKLEKQLEEATSDSLRIVTLMDLASAYAFIDFSKAQTYATKSLELADKLQDPYLRYLANQHMGISYSLGGDYTTALTYEAISLQLAVGMKDTTSMGLSHSNIGNYYHEIGEFDEAYYYLTRGYRLLSKSAKNSLDSIYMNIALHNVGRVFKELGQYDVALQHLRLSKRVSHTLHDAEGIPYSLDEIGDVKLRMREYDSALLYLEDALAEIHKLLLENPQSTVRELKPKTYIKIAQTHSSKGDFEKALLYYDSTIRIHELTKNQFGIAEVEFGRGSIFMQQGEYDKAITYINRALAMGSKLNAKVLQLNCYTHLSELWEKKGDFKKSLEAFKRYKTLNDSLFSQETQQKLFRDQVRFETEVKDDKIASLIKLEELQKTEIKKQEFIRNILVVVVALTAILLLTVYRSGQRRRRINMLLLQHQEEMEKRSEELEQLNKVKDKFFSIISHDLRSPINALAGLLDLIEKGAINEDEMPAAMRELRIRFNHTRTLLNNLLDWTLLQMDKLNLQAAKIDLHKIVNENIDLLSSIQGKNIALINNIPENAIGLADSNTINLVIRNLITNALKFTNDGGEVMINAEDKGREWVIAVHDNGIGMSKEIQQKLFDKINPYSTRGTANEKGTGLGLILCKEFVEKNGGRIWVESEEGKGSTFWFTLPKPTIF